MGYTYRGTQLDAHLPLPPLNRRDTQGFDETLCGTRPGYVHHRRLREAACQPCKDANAAYLADYRDRAANRQITRGWTGDSCGTLAGYNSHRRHGQTPCDDCREANASYCKARREQQKQEAA